MPVRCCIWSAKAARSSVTGAGIDDDVRPQPDDRLGPGCRRIAGNPPGHRQAGEAGRQKVARMGDAQPISLSGATTKISTSAPRPGRHRPADLVGEHDAPAGGVHEVAGQGPAPRRSRQGRTALGPQASRRSFEAASAPSTFNR